jgi:hypothetical protein
MSAQKLRKRDATVYARMAAYTIITFLMLASIIAVFIALGVFGIEWIWPVAVVPLGALLFVVVSHSRLPGRHFVIKVLELLCPIIGILLAEQERRQKNSYVVKHIEYTLLFYNLCVLLDAGVRTLDADNRCTLEPDFREKLIGGMPHVAIESERVKDCAKKVAEHLQSIELNSPADLLELLYWERQGATSETGVLWFALRQRLAPDLAKILAKSGRLPERDGHPPYEINDLARILKAFDNFILDLLKIELSRLDTIYHCARRYLAFLDRNDIADQRMTMAAMLGMVDLPIDPAKSSGTMLNVLIRAGKGAIRRAYPVLPDISWTGRDGDFELGTTESANGDGEELLDSLSLISLAVFFTEELAGSLELRSQVCQMAAQKRKALYIVLGYLEFREDLRNEDRLDGKEFVSIDYVVQHWAGRVKKKKDELGRGFDKELAAIRDILWQGDWLRRVPFLINRTLEVILTREEQVVERVYDLSATRPSIHEALKAIFMTLSLQTIERYLEARQRTAYLLNFRVEGGCLAPLLNCLVSDVPAKISTLQTFGIDLKASDQLKYNFEQYTPFARIGVVPKGWTFDRFCATFQEDFEKLVAARTQLLTAGQLANPLSDIEVIVSRFGLSGRDYCGLELAGLTRPQALEKIRELFVNLLEVDELITLIKYEREESIAQIIASTSIATLVGDQVALTQQEREALEDEDWQLKDRICARLKCSDVRDLGKVLLARPAQRRGARNRLSVLLGGSVPQFANRSALCTSIADAYVDTLADVARIDN